MAKRDGGIRVLFVDAGVGLAGGQYSLIENLKLLDRTRVVPLVSSPRGSGLESFCMDAGIEWMPLPFATLQIGPDGEALSSPVTAYLDAARGIVHIARIARSRRVDIIHANSFKAAVVAGVASLLTMTPMVFHSRAIYSHPPVGDLVARVSRRIVALSKTTAGPYMENYAGKIRIVPSGVDTERFRPSERSRGGALVGYLGRISQEKGLIHLVRSAPRVISRVPDVRFIVGGRPFTEEGVGYLRAVEAEIERLGLGGRFDWAGYVDDVPAFLEQASVIVVPSEEEGLGRTMLEAMAMERPVVATDCGGPGEVITSGVDGILVAQGDPEALGGALADLLKDPERAAGIGKAGRAKVDERYSSRASTEALLKVYDEIVPGRTR